MNLHSRLDRLEKAAAPPPAPEAFSFPYHPGREGWTQAQLDAFLARAEADPEGDGSDEAKVNAAVAHEYRARGRACAEGMAYWLATKGIPGEMETSIGMWRDLGPGTFGAGGSACS